MPPERPNRGYRGAGVTHRSYPNCNGDFHFCESRAILLDRAWSMSSREVVRAKLFDRQRFYMRERGWAQALAGTTGPFLGQRSRGPNGFVVFLFGLGIFMTRLSMWESAGTPPAPRDPCTISPLNQPHCKVEVEQMPRGHTAAKEPLELHYAISREASIASSAASCSDAWRRRSRA
jgi:hypothetical protein